MADFIILNTGQSPADGRGKNGRTFDRLNSNIKVRDSVNNPIGSIGSSFITPVMGSALLLQMGFGSNIYRGLT